MFKLLIREVYMTKTTKKVSWQDMLFWLGVTIVLLLSTKKSFSLPFYWDTAWFLVPAGYAIAQTGNLFSYFGGSDYPHTFLLPLIIAFIIKLTTNHLFFIPFLHSHFQKHFLERARTPSSRLRYGRFKTAVVLKLISQGFLN